MNSSNMLGANKVKLHGMTSSKWTTRDQITQYKGLISLYTKDRKIFEMENKITKKRQAKQLRVVQRNIETNRKVLNNLLNGDKQKLRCTLLGHKELELMFQDASPQKVIDKVHHANFNKRKMKDLLSYKLKTKSKTLIDLNLKCADYVDKLKYEEKDKLLPSEKRAYLLNGKVQDSILRTEASVYIRNTYGEIIAIMKKDALYFDAILLTLEKDGLRQGKCLLNITKIGQEAAEYLDNRRNDYQFFETLVKKEMWDRKRDLDEVRQNVQKFRENFKKIIKDDNDVNIGKMALEYSPSCDQLDREIKTIETTFNMLKNAVSTFSVDLLYPLIREQCVQKERLVQFMEKCKIAKQDLLEKTRRASELYSRIATSTLDTTASYNAVKVELKMKIDKQIDYSKKIQVGIDARSNLLAKIRVSLKHLQYLSRLLTTDTRESTHLIYRNLNIPFPVAPEPDEVNILNIVPELIKKFSKLVEKSENLLNNKLTFNAFKLYEELMRDRSKSIPVDGIAVDGELIETEFMDSTVPTSDDIKKQSEEIVAIGLAALEYKPPTTTKKTYKFKKSRQ